MSASDEEDRKPAAIEHHSFVEDDEDNWSRRVENDETATGHLLHAEDSYLRMESPRQEICYDPSPLAAVLPPSQPELTMKEKLVLRERQRRIETERARLKQQFALRHHSASETSSVEEDDDHHGDTAGGRSATMAAFQENGSVAGTLGEESTIAHPDEETAALEKLGFNMERFLRNSDNFKPQAESNNSLLPLAETEGGVVMERFLSNPVVVEADDGDRESTSGHDDTEGLTTDVQRSVSFDVDASHPNGDGVIPTSMSAFPDGANVSLQAESHIDAQRRHMITSATLTGIPSAPRSMDAEVASDGNLTDVHSQTSSTRTADEFRVMRLTEADMREMEAIDEVSIGNAPPSEREEELLSEVGELADFRGGFAGAAGNYSQGTRTTAMESASLISGGIPSDKQASEDHTRDHSQEHREHYEVVDTQATEIADKHSLDGMTPGSMSSHLMVSPGASAAGSTLAQPSNAGVLDESIDGTMARLSVQPKFDDKDVSSDMASVPASLRNSADDLTAHAGNESILNRRVRPGMPGLKPAPQNLEANRKESSTSVNAASGPPIVVDDFDYDINAPETPRSTNDEMQDSFLNSPDGPPLWTLEENMIVSPVQQSRSGSTPVDSLPASQIYGSMTTGRAIPAQNGSAEESAPLLSVPPEIITMRERSEMSSLQNVAAHVKHQTSLSSSQNDHTRHESVFETLRAEEEHVKEEEQTESELYNTSNVLARAFPERLMALIVTLILEIPVLLMISGGSDNLCFLIGRRRYHLLVGFIPLTSAISGNVGLQSSTLTTRAISHFHVTESSFIPWLMREIGAAACLGCGMGIIMGIIAFIASEMDLAFGVTIFIAQIISILTAGLTGTLAPLLFSFIFRKDSGKWGGPLETAVQDIVGSFAMIVISFHLLAFLGPGEIDAGDTCGSQ
ncbi:predicted protein [Phaeodactylum tricornutum CCAP 1055/1]|jgi:hypothetical protein|uniref:SLC41A/MgtE integral membrane domain-containing protein n=1 Tax=Phaeodactylum tricornutum (strain CCAP 1055/1) TaxID=556484 RepID=B5Y5B7_PHATC|nr:predicted protein [Phaeodactylum tricornutum CCAP 1055/1]ACI65628.1 predicted protein [Phaeodactylum tricornutum CCAP 1055/1]|eukprot:XP_002186158.1 predicted protein [Phaeodactylum tricornutum CCAP 1055/1]